MDHNPVIHIVYIISLAAIKDLDILIRARNLCLGRGFHGIGEGLGYAVVRDSDGFMPPGGRLLHRGGGIRQSIHVAHGGMQVQLHPLFSRRQVLAFGQGAGSDGIGPEHHFVFKTVLRQLSLNPQNSTHLDMLQNGLCFLGLHKPADANGAGVVRHVELDHPGVPLGQLLMVHSKDFSFYDHRTHIQGQLLHGNRRPPEGFSVDGIRVLGLGLGALRFRRGLGGQLLHHPVPHGVQGIKEGLPLQAGPRFHLNRNFHTEARKKALPHLWNQLFQGIFAVGGKPNGQIRSLPAPPGTRKRPPGHGIQADKKAHQFLRLTFCKLRCWMGHCQFHLAQGVSGRKLPGCPIQKTFGNIALGMGKYMHASAFRVQIGTINRRLRKGCLQLLRRRIIRKHIQNRNCFIHSLSL